MKPRKNFRGRPKKLGAKKRQKVLSQKRRIVAAGGDAAGLDKLNTVEVRELLKKTVKKAAKKTAAKPAAKKKTTSKSVAKKKA